jgi:hypothetical protein
MDHRLDVQRTRIRFLGRSVCDSRLRLDGCSKEPRRERTSATSDDHFCNTYLQTSKLLVCPPLMNRFLPRPKTFRSRRHCSCSRNTFTLVRTMCSARVADATWLRLDASVLDIRLRAGLGNRYDFMHETSCDSNRNTLASG